MELTDSNWPGQPVITGPAPETRGSGAAQVQARQSKTKSLGKGSVNQRDQGWWRDFDHGIRNTGRSAQCLAMKWLVTR